MRNSKADKYSMGRKLLQVSLGVDKAFLGRKKKSGCKNHPMVEDTIK
jgi:hypothetical protein